MASKCGWFNHRWSKPRRTGVGKGQVHCRRCGRLKNVKIKCSVWTFTPHRWRRDRRVRKSTRFVCTRCGQTRNAGGK